MPWRGGRECAVRVVLCECASPRPQLRSRGLEAIARLVSSQHADLDARAGDGAAAEEERFER